MTNRVHHRKPATVALVLTVLLAIAVVRSWSASDADDPLQFTEWATPVNLGAPISTVGAEVTPFISRDGLSLYFSCNNCPGGYGSFDIYVSRRASENDLWGPPQNLGPTINTGSGESNPVLSHDEHLMYFTSPNRPDGFGSQDLYVSRRHNRRDDFAWQTPKNLGPTINTPAAEAQATYFEDPHTGVIQLYFASDRPGGPGLRDIYVSTLQENGTFSTPELVAELSGPADDQSPAIRRRDGLEIFLESNRPGSLVNVAGRPSNDVWVSTRSSTSEAWSEPVNLGAVVNSIFHDSRVGLSWDATTMYLQTARPENVTPQVFDIWVTTRTKLKQADQEGDH